MSEDRPNVPDPAQPQTWLIRHAGAVTVAAILFGVVCRLGQYLARISFWHDEAYIVLNVYNHGYAALLGALDHDQTAPPGFLWAVKASLTLLGSDEFGFRLTPVAASIIALPLFALLARRVLSPAAALPALAMFCLSPKLLEHTAEVKQYSTDVLAAIVLTLIAVGPRNKSAGLRLLVLSLVAAGMFWLAEISIFVFAGVVPALAPAVCRGPRRGWLYFLGLAVPAASFLILYKLSIEPQSTHALYSYWKDYMADWHRWPVVPVWSVGRMLGVANYSYDPLGWLIFPISLVGGWRLYRQDRRQLLAVLVFPAAVVFLAACADQYPMGKRVTLFLAPSVLLLAAAGIEALPAIVPSRAKRYCPLVPVAAVGVGFALAAWHLAVPRNESHLRPAVEYLRRNRAPDERVFVVGTNSHEIFQAYWRKADSLISYPIDLPETVGGDRFWVVFEFDPSQGMRHRLPSLERARAMAQEEKKFEGSGGAAYLFVLKS
ncbi:MAG: glycosyltransferase family 39 protein [Tepidisphaeraceae bacterium]|jgi:hypothetical protein